MTALSTCSTAGSSFRGFFFCLLFRFFCWSGSRIRRWLLRRFRHVPKFPHANRPGTHARHPVARTYRPPSVRVAIYKDFPLLYPPQTRGFLINSVDYRENQQDDPRPSPMRVRIYGWTSPTEIRPGASRSQDDRQEPQGSKGDCSSGVRMTPFPILQRRKIGKSAKTAERADRREVSGDGND